MMSILKKIFRGYFVTGTLVLVPLILTIWILKAIITTADSFLIELLPTRLHPETIFGKDIPGLGLIATFVLILMTGVVARLYVGKLVIRFGDYVMSKIPLGRSIYGGLKQLLATFLTRDHSQFRSVVVVEFPKKDTYMLGFVSGDVLPELASIDRRRLINVFIPTTPNPTTGFLAMFPEDEVHPVDLSIEEAFKLVVSGGIVSGRGLPE